MDSETEKKLTELQHQNEMLRKDMEANMRTMKAESESAIERLRADMERSVHTITIRMIGVVGLGVAILGGLITVLQFLK